MRSMTSLDCLATMCTSLVQFCVKSVGAEYWSGWVVMRTVKTLRVHGSADTFTA